MQKPARSESRSLLSLRAGFRIGSRAKFLMGSSFVEYNGRGFWSWDGYLEDVLAYLANQIGPTETEEWLVELRDHWHQQSTGIFRGWIHPQLSEFVPTDERRVTILALLDHSISQTDLTGEARQTMQFFAALLRGEVDTDESSPLDYLVHGEFPYEPSAGSKLKHQMSLKWSDCVVHRWIVLGERHRLRARTPPPFPRDTDDGPVTIGKIQMPPNSLAIVQLPSDDGFHLLYVGSGWIELAGHGSEAKALAQATREFNVAPDEWERAE